MVPKLTRRTLLGGVPLGLAVGLCGQVGSRTPVPAPAKKAKPLPSVGEFTRLVDPVTENAVVRLTSPAFTSRLTAEGNQFVSVRERTLIFSSNRTGRMTPFQVDLRTGAARQIADAEKLDPRSLCLDHSQKSAYFLDGSSLRQAPLTRGNPQTLTEDVSWFRVNSDGTLFAIQSGKLARRDGSSWRTISDSATACWPRPGGAGCLVARNGTESERELWYVDLTYQAKPLLMATGLVRDPFWDADGQSILFLRDVTNANGVPLVQIHSKGLHAGEPELCLSSTSQFAAFAPNADCSVFVGASRSHAQPTVVLQLRTPSREMTLCEHGSKHPEQVAPAFSPDSRRVYFESEREGNPAIYSVSVELLVEPIATG